MTYKQATTLKLGDRVIFKHGKRKGQEVIITKLYKHQVGAVFIGYGSPEPDCWSYASHADFNLIDSNRGGLT